MDMNIVRDLINKVNYIFVISTIHQNKKKIL